MKSRSTDLIPTDLALWRYGLISPFLHRDSAGRTLEEVLEELAKPEYRDPRGGSRRFSPETLRKWLARYKTGGLAGLADQERSDKGRTLVPEPLLRRIRGRWP